MIKLRIFHMMNRWLKCAGDARLIANGETPSVFRKMQILKRYKGMVNFSMPEVRNGPNGFDDLNLCIYLGKNIQL